MVFAHIPRSGSPDKNAPARHANLLPAPTRRELRTAVQEPGEALPPSVRAFFEPRFGHDFSHVRVHADDRAARSAEALNAAAYAVGQHVAFGRGKYQPGTGAGLRLLAHELSHVSSHPPSSSPEPTVVADPAAGQEHEAHEAASSLGKNRPYRAVDDGMVHREPLDPSGPLESTPTEPSHLTNQELLWEIGAAEHAGSSSSSGQVAEDRYRLLLAEREERVRAGHLWLRDPRAVDLFQLRGEGGSAVVQHALGDPRRALGHSTTPTFSRAQLDAALAEHGVESIDVTDLSDPLGPRTTALGAGAVPGPSIAPLVMGKFYPFLRPLTAAERALVAQRGAVHYTPESNLPDMVQPDETVRIRPSRGRLNLSQTPFVNVTDPAWRQSSYFFVGEASPRQYQMNLAGGPSAGSQARIFVQGADLPDGLLFRPVDRVLAVPGGYSGRAEVVRPGATVPAGSGMSQPTSGERTSMAAQLRSQGSFSGHPLAVGAGAAGLAIVFDSGVLLYRTGELPEGRRVAETGLSGALGGFTGGMAEQGVARSIASTAIGRSVNPVFITLGRGGAGLAGGFIAAPVVEVTRMALDDQRYSRTDYAARGTRAAVAGAGSGLLAAGATAALAGSVAPGVGTAIGFVVGVASYLVIDWMVGDAVEAEVRDMAR